MSNSKTSVHKRHDRVTGRAADADTNRLAPVVMRACLRSGCKRPLGHHRGIHGAPGTQTPGTRAQRRTALRDRVRVELARDDIARKGD